ncbi:alpha/beta hydrolase [Thiomicrorhabdus arctica]|jgi:pimeloyl-ACP methyl ester carboxylesterase|uniref:alpha/beta hydrolase n=1 Tax=Thiomicrorhabdus arctica TaxID=131540 RepID=UPI000378EABC|nr:alpha/beta hydrolase [Thiomicrorhabdus arctica]
MLFKNSKIVALSFSLLAGLLSFSIQTVQAKEMKSTYNGLTVNANVVLADGKTLADEVVLFIHGTTTHNGRETYKSIQKLLAENGISSVAPNLSLDVNDRHGEVDCTTLQSHTHDDAMAEIDFWVKWLAKQGAKSITLMGHSRGGNQTAWYSVEHDSDLIKKVVLVAPQTWSNAAEHNDYEKKYHVALQPLLARAEKLVKAGKGDTVLKHVNFIYCKDTNATAEAFVSYYRADERMDTPTLLKKATKPTLVIIGSADKVVADLAEKMATVNNPLVSRYIIDGSNHFFLDFFSEELVEQAVGFIQQ